MNTKIHIVLLFLCSFLTVSFLGMWVSPSKATYVNATEAKPDALTHTDNDDSPSPEPPDASTPAKIQTDTVAKQEQQYEWMKYSESLLQPGNATTTIDLTSTENQAPLKIWSEEDENSSELSRYNQANLPDSFSPVNSMDAHLQDPYRR